MTEARALMLSIDFGVWWHIVDELKVERNDRTQKPLGSRNIYIYIYIYIYFFVFRLYRYIKYNKYI
jgi:hypothetical protein